MFIDFIFQFFKKEVPNVPNQYDLFNEVTGMNFTGRGKLFLSQVRIIQIELQLFRVVPYNICKHKCYHV